MTKFTEADYKTATKASEYISFLTRAGIEADDINDFLNTKYALPPEYSLLGQLTKKEINDKTAEAWDNRCQYINKLEDLATLITNNPESSPKHKTLAEKINTQTKDDTNKHEADVKKRDDALKADAAKLEKKAGELKDAFKITDFAGNIADSKTTTERSIWSRLEEGPHQLTLAERQDLLQFLVTLGIDTKVAPTDAKNPTSGNILSETGLNGINELIGAKILTTEHQENSKKNQKALQALSDIPQEMYSTIDRERVINITSNTEANVDAFHAIHSRLGSDQSLRLFADLIRHYNNTQESNGTPLAGHNIERIINEAEENYAEHENAKYLVKEYLRTELSKIDKNDRTYLESALLLEVEDRNRTYTETFKNIKLEEEAKTPASQPNLDKFNSIASRLQNLNTLIDTNDAKRTQALELKNKEIEYKNNNAQKDLDTPTTTVTTEKNTPEAQAARLSELEIIERTKEATEARRRSNTAGGLTTLLGLTAFTTWTATLSTFGATWAPALAKGGMTMVGIVGYGSIVGGALIGGIYAYNEYETYKKHQKELKDHYDNYPLDENDRKIATESLEIEIKEAQSNQQTSRLQTAATTFFLVIAAILVAVAPIDPITKATLIVGLVSGAGALMAHHTRIDAELSDLEDIKGRIEKPEIEKMLEKETANPKDEETKEPEINHADSRQQGKTGKSDTKSSSSFKQSIQEEKKELIQL